MSQELKLQGSLTVSPVGGVKFPGNAGSIPLELIPNPKQASEVFSGQATIVTGDAKSLSFGEITEAVFIYLKCDQLIYLAGISGSSLDTPIPILGTFILETDSDEPFTSLTLNFPQDTQVEYLIAGE